MRKGSVIQSFFRKFLFYLKPDIAHDLAIFSAKIYSSFHNTFSLLGFKRKLPKKRNCSLSIGGLHFPNPVGLAAGLDKNGIALPLWSKIGFGFAEFGTVTPKKQFGNSKPRLFRDR